MPISQLIGRGIGFHPGGVRYIVTAGLTPGGTPPPPSATTLTQAVIAAWNSFKSAKSLPNLYNGEVPEDQIQAPSAQFVHRGEKGKYNFTSIKPYQIDGKFEIHLYQIGQVACESLAVAAMQGFTPTSVSVVGATSTFIFRDGDYTCVGTNMERAGAGSSTGNQVFHATIFYSALIMTPPF